MGARAGGENSIFPLRQRGSTGQPYARMRARAVRAGAWAGEGRASGEASRAGQVWGRAGAEGLAVAMRSRDRRAGRWEQKFRLLAMRKNGAGTCKPCTKVQKIRGGLARIRIGK